MNDNYRNPKQISTLSEYIDYVTVLGDECSDILFRGQAENRPLLPSIGRKQGYSNFLTKEQMIMEDFKRESIAYLDLQPKNDWQWLAIAQHKRLPTRLLDWTTSSLTALWFAVSEDIKKKESPRIVWSLYLDHIKAIYNTENMEDLGSPFDIDQVKVYFPEHVFPFIQAQSSVFTVHPTKDSSRDFHPLEPLEKSNSLILKPIEIPSYNVETIRKQLFHMGISPGSLFPGLSGLARKLCYIHKL